jgi:transposase
MLPLGFVLTPGQQHEATVVPDLILSIPDGDLRLPAKVAGDKGYSSPAIRAFLSACGSEPVIPYRRDELERMTKPPRFDRRAYRRRNAVERLVGRLEEWRRIGTRYEKLAVNFAAMVRIAFIRLYLAR